MLKIVLKLNETRWNYFEKRLRKKWTSKINFNVLKIKDAIEA